MKYYLFILLFVSLSLLPTISYSESNVDLKEPNKSGKQDENQAAWAEEDIEEIIVTATRTETPVSQLPDSVSIVSRAQIDQQKATT
ncbi:MAG: hypothetical protein HOL31_13650, partial [Candidatus Scalindua sp.]|nr:hypothetical protein [Candidatus Scalindua sp.]